MLRRSYSLSSASALARVSLERASYFLMSASYSAACLAASALSTPLLSSRRSVVNPFSSPCNLMRVDWYSAQASTEAACAFCIACTMLSSFTLPIARNTVSTTTVTATRSFSRRSCGLLVLPPSLMLAPTQNRMRRSLANRGDNFASPSCGAFRMVRATGDLLSATGDLASVATILRALTLAAALVYGAAQAQQLDEVSFATNWVAQAEHGGFYQALVDGTYKKHGLDVTLVPGGPNVNHRLQLIAGRIEFYMSANTLQAFD